jgi:hypothetical protein
MNPRQAAVLSMCYCWHCSAGIDGKAEEFADASQTLGSGIEGIDEGEGLEGEGEGVIDAGVTAPDTRAAMKGESPEYIYW